MTLSCSSESSEDPVILPTINAQAVSILEGEEEKPIFIDFRLNQSSDEEIRFSVQTEDGTATSGEDYTKIDLQELSIRSGSTRESLRVVIQGDTETEGDEVFYVLISNAQGATITESRIEITIENDDISNDYVIPSSGYSTPEDEVLLSLVSHDKHICSQDTVLSVFESSQRYSIPKYTQFCIHIGIKILEHVLGF